MYAVAITTLLVNFSPLLGYSNASLCSHRLNRLPLTRPAAPTLFPRIPPSHHFNSISSISNLPFPSLNSPPRHTSEGEFSPAQLTSKRWMRSGWLPPSLKDEERVGERASGCLELSRSENLFAAMSGTRAAVAAAAAAAAASNDRASRPAAGASIGVGLKRLRSEPGGNRVTVVLGAQWGDEGKGKVVDLLATEADLVCRCQVSKGCPGTETAAPRPVSCSATLEPISPLVFAVVAFRMRLFTCAGETFPGMFEH